MLEVRPQVDTGRASCGVAEPTIWQAVVALDKVLLSADRERQTCYVQCRDSLQRGHSPPKRAACVTEWSLGPQRDDCNFVLDVGLCQLHQCFP